MFWSCCLRSRHGRAQKCEFSFRWLLTTLRNWLLSWMTKKNNPSQTPPGKQLFSSVRNEQKRDLTLTHVLAAQIFPLRCLLTFFSSPKTLFFNQSEKEHTAHRCKGLERYFKTKQVSRAEKHPVRVCPLEIFVPWKHWKALLRTSGTFANCLNGSCDKRRGENCCYHFQRMTDLTNRFHNKLQREFSRWWVEIYGNEGGLGWNLKFSRSLKHKYPSVWPPHPIGVE